MALKINQSATAIDSKQMGFNSSVGNNGAYVSATSADGKTKASIGFSIGGIPSAWVERTVYEKEQETHSVQSLLQKPQSYRDIRYADFHYVKQLQEAGVHIGTTLSGESGGVLPHRKRTQFDIGLGFEDGTIAKVAAHRFSGSELNNQKTGASLEMGVGIGGSLYHERLTGKTTANHSGFSAGARMNSILKTPELDLSYITSSTDGLRYRFNIGGVVSNLAYGNFAGALINIWSMFKPEKINSPQYEIVSPDDKPDFIPDAKMFQRGTTELTREAHRSYDEIARHYLKNNGQMTIHVGRQYDNSGGIANADTEKMNQERQHIVVQELMKRGIPYQSIQMNEAHSHDEKINIKHRNSNVYIQSLSDLMINEAHFETKRFSPAGMRKMDEIMQNPEFKDFLQGKSRVEQEILQNLAFSNTVSRNPALGLSQFIEAVQKSIYQAGLTLENMLTSKSDQDALKLIQNKDEFKQFVQQHQIENKEEKRLAKRLLEQIDTQQISQLSDGLKQYQSAFLSRGLTLTDLSQNVKQYEKAIEQSNLYKNVLSQHPKQEAEYLKQDLMYHFINDGRYRDFESYLKQREKVYQEHLYDKGDSLLRKQYLSDQQSNPYSQQLLKDTKQYIKTHQYELFTANSFIKNEQQEKRLFEHHLFQSAINNPHLSVEENAQNLIQQTYGQNRTIADTLEIQYKKEQEHANQKLSNLIHHQNLSQNMSLFPNISIPTFKP